VLGLIFILVILFARAGIVGSAAKLVARARRRGTPRPPDDRGSPKGTPVPAGNHTE
jgi:branched-chain amino acid transport system permease protein